MKTAKFPSTKSKIYSFVFISVLFLSSNSIAQDKSEERTSDLSGQFQELKAESESYNDYKVIKTYKLNTFWKQVEDTLGSYRKEINNSGKEIASLKGEIAELNRQLAEVKNSLEESESRNDSISVFGIDVQKSFYNVVVWAIIGGLLFLAGSMAIGFKKNTISTRKAKKDYHDLMEEFDVYRKESREKQMKLGRELQTERNKLEEYREKLGRKEKAH